MKCLIADDSFLSRQFITDILRPIADYDVACDGREAMYALELSWSNHQNYDFIVLDIDMPKKSGREVLQFLRSREAEQGIHPGQGSKVIMLTSHRDADSVFGTFRDGCEAYLMKPASEQKVLHELERLGLIGQPAKLAATSHQL
ncbi:MAG: response regulator [Planctomycetota bacterium]